MITHDTTDLVTACTDLEELLQRMELAVRTAGLGIWTYAVNEDRLQWNAEQHRIYGLSPQEFAESPDDWRALVLPEDRSEADQRFAELLACREVYDLRCRIRRPDAELRTILASGRHVRTERGEVKEIVGINLDITETAQSRGTWEQSSGE